MKRVQGGFFWFYFASASGHFVTRFPLLSASHVLRQNHELPPGEGAPVAHLAPRDGGEEPAVADGAAEVGGGPGVGAGGGVDGVKLGDEGVLAVAEAAGGQVAHQPLDALLGL